MQSIKHLNWIICFVLLGVILTWDILFRLIVQSNLVNSSVEYRDIVSFNSTTASAEQAKSILHSFERFDKPEETTLKTQAKVSNVMDESEQRKQSGSLARLFDGDYEYKLSGVFWDSSYFAILSKKHLVTNDIQEIKLRSGDLLGDYRVAAITQFKIDFVREMQQVSLPMFLAPEAEAKAD